MPSSRLVTLTEDAASPASSPSKDKSVPVPGPAALAFPDDAVDAPKLVDLLGRIGEAQAEIDRLYARWSELQERASS